MTTNCCGRGRPMVQPHPLPARPPARPPEPAAALPPTVAFVYTGSSRLVAEGPFTRRRYRFDAPGAQADVDARDAPSFAAIPALRRVAR
jgi:hypothetical protein